MNTTAPGAAGQTGHAPCPRCSGQTYPPATLCLNCEAASHGEHILYRHWGKNGNLLYAGRTNNPPARLAKHRSEADWWSLVSWTTYEKFPSLEALKDEESWVIKNEHPEWNIQGREYPATTRKSQEPGTDRYPPLTSDLRLTIELVHPLSREFSVYGGNDAVRRAREWALRHRYYLLDTGHTCAHALYLMHCPQFGNCLPHADHTQVWIPAPDFSDFERYSGAPAPFVLTQPYRGALGLPDADAEPERPAVPDLLLYRERARASIPADITAYAAAHGLDAETWQDDAWYHPSGCVPIRLTPSGSSHVLFPLAIEALSLMCAWRDDWPDAIPEWLK